MKYDIEMVYGIGFTASNIEANSRKEAIKQAKEIIENEITILDVKNVDVSNLEFEEVTFVSNQNK